MDGAGVHQLHAMADREPHFAIVLPEGTFLERVLAFPDCIPGDGRRTDVSESPQ